jgi:hypothetical protein
LKETFSGHVSGEAVKGYATTYIMELIEVVLLPYGFGDYISAMYVQFLGYMICVKRYSWGFMVLTRLSCNLCTSCMTDTSGILGPPALL